MLLTGMGRDGARGLLQLRRQGWWTIRKVPGSGTGVGSPGPTGIQFDKVLDAVLGGLRQDLPLVVDRAHRSSRSTPSRPAITNSAE